MRILPRSRRLFLATLALGLLAAQSLYAQTAAERAAEAGELVTLKGQKVLRLYGEDAKERGFAHGYYLASGIVEAMDDALKSLPFFTVEKFEKRLIPWSKDHFQWDAASVREFEGVFEGLCAKLSEKERVCPALGRAVTLDDIYAINVIADYYGPACSGFSAWGPLTEDGKVVYGRNLDFPIGPRAVGNQVLLANERLRGHEKEPKRRAWIGVGWPGLITVFTAMNEDGLVCCLHDATNVIKGGPKDGYVARGLLLRRMLEAIDPDECDPAAAAAKMAAERPAACGNLFHLAWPAAAAQKHKSTPSAVLEFDGTGREEAGAKAVSIRRMDERNYLVVTNHYCLRSKELECNRFAHITDDLAALARNNQKVDLAAARKLLIGGELPTAAHTVVFLPDSRTMHVAITRANFLSTRVAATAFSAKELLKRGNADKEK
ncbi:MAG: hypothetical protein HY291_11430 [Planctomycetes bacterium]|nr:hypothetical protein [Planctomycetota bacterium]